MLVACVKGWKVLLLGQEGMTLMNGSRLSKGFQLGYGVSYIGQVLPKKGPSASEPKRQQGPARRL